MTRFFPENLLERWKTPHDLIQVFLGPRQVGKTTAATELAPAENSVFLSADAPTPPPHSLITEKWIEARQINSDDRTLVLDEIQKIPGWSEVVKKLWDEDRRNRLKMRVAILGSSALLIEKGLSESLTGRVELNYFPHWTFAEVQRLRATSIFEYLILGGYPKAYEFGADTERSRNYIESAIVEPTLGRDILALHAVDKPALLRQLFWYVSRLPAQIVSFEKILGHLQDRGNSATLTHYAELLRLAFLVVPIFKFTNKPHRSKRSLPKWIFPNPALVDRSLHSQEPTGFLFENLVGSHLLNLTYGKSRYQVSYWREDNQEIDYIVTDSGKPILMIEVKSGRPRRLPTSSRLKSIDLNCDMALVTPSNIERFLGQLKIDGLFGVLE